MKKIRIIFYKARFGDGHWIDNAISIWTGLISRKNRKVGPYSHVEIWTPLVNEDSIYGPYAFDLSGILGADIHDRVGTCWTSTMRGKDNGTVKRPANTIIKNPARWDFAEFEITDEKYNTFIGWAENKVKNNKGYSKRDLLKFFGLGLFADDSKDICSEFSNDGLVIMDILTAFGVVSPRRLAYLIKKAGCQIKPLK